MPTDLLRCPRTCFDVVPAELASGRPDHRPTPQECSAKVHSGRSPGIAMPTPSRRAEGPGGPCSPRTGAGARSGRRSWTRAPFPERLSHDPRQGQLGPLRYPGEEGRGSLALAPNTVALGSPDFTVKVSISGARPRGRGETWRKPAPEREGRALRPRHGEGPPVLRMPLSSCRLPQAPPWGPRGPRVSKPGLRARGRRRAPPLQTRPSPLSTTRRGLCSFPVVPRANGSSL